MFDSKEFAYEEENLMKVLPHLVRIMTFLITVDRDVLISDVWEQSLAVYIARRFSYLPNCAALLANPNNTAIQAICHLATQDNTLDTLANVKQSSGETDFYSEELNKLVGANLRSRLVLVNVKVMKKVKKTYDRSSFERDRRSLLRKAASPALRPGTLPTQSNPAWDRLHTSFSHLGDEKLPRVQSAPLTDKHTWKATSGPVIGDFVYFTSQCFGQIRGRPAPYMYLVHIHSWPQKRYDPVQRPESQAVPSDFLYLEKEELVWRDNRYCVK